ncbi:MAG: transcription termination/antitermination NusG family protein [Chloroflexota bacterium]
MTVSWYAMRSKPNKEEFLAAQLQAYGLEVFFPVLHVKPVNPRARKFRPYFPNYLFVHVDLGTVNISDLNWMPGASGLVSFGGEPASVPDLLIAALKKQIEHHNAFLRDQQNNFQRGDVVLIETGPFAGYEAVFDTHLSGRERVRVLLSLLQRRQMPVEIESRHIRRVKRS